ncbi:MAG: integration host factor subunit beta [Planctomycetes bacterium]|nr:integration host factor subunit beta [Planctomycetota bacterium]
MVPESRTITKKELVNRIADETRQTKVVVKDILQRFLDAITEELAEGNRIEFRDFGVFEVRERAPRRAQNPRTLEEVEVPQRRAVKFKAGRRMGERISEGPTPRPEPAPAVAPEALAPPRRPQPPAPPTPEPPKAPPSTPGSPF